MRASLPSASSPEHCLPRIQFLFIASRLCSTLLSDLTSRFGPCASLSLHLHLVVKRTCTSQLSIMLGTQCKLGSRAAPQFVYLAVSVSKHSELRALFESMRTACAVCSAFVSL